MEHRIHCLHELELLHLVLLKKQVLKCWVDNRISHRPKKSKLLLLKETSPEKLMSPVTGVAQQARLTNIIDKTDTIVFFID